MLHLAPWVHTLRKAPLHEVPALAASFFLESKPSVTPARNHSWAAVFHCQEPLRDREASHLRSTASSLANDKMEAASVSIFQARSICHPVRKAAAARPAADVRPTCASRKRPSR